MDIFHTYGSDGLVSVNEIAEAIYELTIAQIGDVAGFNIAAASTALVLKNSIEDPVDLAAYVAILSSSKKQEDIALYAALTRSRPIDKDELEFHRTNTNQWHLAIISAATTNKWQLFCLYSLAPLPSDTSTPCMVSAQAIVAWLEKIGRASLSAGIADRLAVTSPDAAKKRPRTFSELQSAKAKMPRKKTEDGASAKHSAKELFDRWSDNPALYKNKAAFNRDVVAKEWCSSVTANKWLNSFIKAAAHSEGLAAILPKSKKI